MSDTDTEIREGTHWDDGRDNAVFPESFTPVGGSEKGPANLVDLVKKDLADIASVDHIFIPIQGYTSSGLQIKYRLPRTGRELDKIAAPYIKANRSDAFARNLGIAIALMIELCDGIYVQPPGLDLSEPITFDVDESGEAPRFDIRLETGLGWEPSGSAHKIVRRLFDNSDAAILAHAEELNRWLRNRRIELSQEFVDSLGG